MSSSNIRIELYVFFTGLLFCLLFFCQSCAIFSPIKDIRRRAYIPGSAVSWFIVNGSPSGEIESDLLTNDVAEIELFFFDYNDRNSFIIVMRFKEANGNLLFRPSNISVKFFNGMALKVKGLDNCFDIKNLQFKEPLEERVKVKKNVSYVLLFDHPAPPLEEEIVLYINDALAANGNILEVPPIYFRKTVKNIHRWGFIQ
jgi:hypothetical protein